MPRTGSQAGRGPNRRLPPLTSDIRLVSNSELGSFSWRWPEATEHFERGYAALVQFEGAEFRIRHGIGRRTVYGRPRLHSVTWVENRPTVEGVEADDFARSQSLLSLIKVTKRHLRPTDALPPEYAGFTVGVMSEEVVGRYSPRSLAVKIRLDDIEGWSRHALRRGAAWGRLGTQRRLRSSLPATTAPGPGPEKIPARSDGHAVVEALLQHGSTLEPGSTGSTDFTPNAKANEIVKTDAFAFLTGVLFDQGIPAERAWAAPYLLRQRMGHLDPARIARDPEGVRRADSDAAEIAPLHREDAAVARPRGAKGSAGLPWRCVGDLVGSAIGCGVCSGGSASSTESPRRRPRWRSRSSIATGACRSTAWRAATWPSMCTSVASSSGPGSRIGMIATT